MGQFEVLFQRYILNPRYPSPVLPYLVGDVLHLEDELIGYRLYHDGRHIDDLVRVMLRVEAVPGIDTIF